MALLNGLYLQTSSLKPFGQSNPILMVSLLGKGGHEFIRMILVTLLRWPPCPYRHWVDLGLVYGKVKIRQEFLLSLYQAQMSGERL